MADPRIHRRFFLSRLGVAAFSLSATRAGFADSARRITPAAAFDPLVESFMADRGTPGGALAVLKGTQLVYRRAYGWADREGKIPVQTDSLFRIASLSKPITALAILKLVEEARLNLNARPFELLELARHLGQGKGWDRRWQDITVRHLLHHTGGWDSKQSRDPMFRPRRIAAALDLAGPPQAQDVVRYMVHQPLDFPPGSRYAYSNFGYALLGRVIEKITGRTYEQAVRQSLLSPLGIPDMRLGATSQSGRVPREVHYYTPDNQTTTTSVISPAGETVPWPYGGFCLEAMDAHGGWIASVLDLARLTAAMANPEKSPLLHPTTFQLLQEPPAPPAARNPDGSLAETYYACGWMMRPRGASGRPNSWHTGSLPGTYALWVRRGDGISYVILFNQRSENWLERDSAIDPLLYRAADSINQWPDPAETVW